MTYPIDCGNNLGNPLVGVDGWYLTSHVSAPLSAAGQLCELKKRRDHVKAQIASVDDLRSELAMLDRMIAAAEAR